MNGSILLESAGTLIIPASPKERGKLCMGETEAVFINRRGTELLQLNYTDIDRLKNVRNGGISSTITVTLKDGSAFDLQLDRGLAAYEFLFKH